MNPLVRYGISHPGNQTPEFYRFDAPNPAHNTPNLLNWIEAAPETRERLPSARAAYYIRKARAANPAGPLWIPDGPPSDGRAKLQATPPDSPPVPPALQCLTVAQRRVLHALHESSAPHGHDSAAEVADKLRIAPGTLNAHLFQIYKRLGETNRTHAVHVYRKACGLPL